MHTTTCTRRGPRRPAPTTAAVLAVLLVTLGFVACAGAPPAPEPAAQTAYQLSLVASLERMPSGIAVHGERVFLSLPRWVESGDATVVELVEGRAEPYPSAAANALATGPGALTSVNGLHLDSRGWLWILDNGRVDLRPAAAGVPKLVVWDTVAEREVLRHTFAVEVAPPAGSFLNDIVVDEASGHAYITQSGMGGPPSLVVYDVEADRAWRALDGHAAVSPDPAFPVSVEGEPVLVQRPDGPAPWLVAANPIALVDRGETLLFGPMSGGVLYAIPAAALRDEALSDAERAALVSVWGAKPLTDGIAADEAGSVYATDVDRGAIVRLRAGSTSLDTLVVLADDPRVSFPVAIEAPGDGTLWFTTNQLHRSPLFGGADRRTPPYTVWRAAPGP
jgi:sugar lactone lactonase YvrE